MGFNYAKEKTRFEKEWKKLRKEYEVAVMCADDIESVHTFDWEVFLSRRVYENHTQPLPDTLLNDENNGKCSSLFKKFSSLSTSFDVEDFSDRYAWLESVSDTELYAKLAMLSAEDLELLTLYAIDGYTQTEVALLLGQSQSVISRKISRIKKFLKK